MKPIKLIAIDMDGTLLNHAHEITPRNREAISMAVQNGIHVVISTGRPYIGIHAEELASIGISHAITANGAAIYKIPEKQCIFSSLLPKDLACSIIRQLQEKDIHFNAFIDGNRYGEISNVPLIDKLAMSATSKEYIRSSETLVEDIAAFIEENHLDVQKLSLNFYPLADGTLNERNAVLELLAKETQITSLCGGCQNLEVTKAGTTKAMGLRFLSDMLHVPLEETMAIGDTENDLDIIQTAGIGVAMGNATEQIKKAADFVTLSNKESGVGEAIFKYALSML